MSEVQLFVSASGDGRPLATRARQRHHRSRRSSTCTHEGCGVAVTRPGCTASALIKGGVHVRNEPAPRCCTALCQAGRSGDAGESGDPSGFVAMAVATRPLDVRLWRSALCESGRAPVDQGRGPAIAEQSGRDRGSLGCGGAPELDDRSVGNRRPLGRATRGGCYRDADPGATAADHLAAYHADALRAVDHGHARPQRSRARDQRSRYSGAAADRFRERSRAAVATTAGQAPVGLVAALPVHSIARAVAADEFVGRRCGTAPAMGSAR